jgi:lipopolysaccharide/colanic/teichoic acid biosynthesis glycosyltransferase
MYAKGVKRILDFVCAAVLLAAFSWLFLILGILVAVRLGRPVIFRQERPGLHGRVFTVYKFRTMTDARYSADNADGETLGRDPSGDDSAEEDAGGRDTFGGDAEDEVTGVGAVDNDGTATGAPGELLPDELRLTPFGKKLRATSLDELPELVNILKGEMSFIGPRPLLVKYLPRYSAEQAMRHDVRPGLTGLAQVNGRNALTWEEKFAYDVKYADTLSFALDCRVLAATIRIVAKREGISAEGEATMPEFLGSEGDGG